MSRIHPAEVAEVYDRAQSKCECCNTPFHKGQVVALHHRLALKHGGPNTAPNLMLVIGTHHNIHQDSIHSQVARSRMLGHIIPSWDLRAPWNIPVLHLSALPAVCWRVDCADTTNLEYVPALAGWCCPSHQPQKMLTR